MVEYRNTIPQKYQPQILLLSGLTSLGVKEDSRYVVPSCKAAIVTSGRESKTLFRVPYFISNKIIYEAK